MEMGLACGPCDRLEYVRRYIAKKKRLLDVGFITAMTRKQIVCCTNEELSKVA